MSQDKGIFMSASGRMIRLIYLLSLIFIVSVAAAYVFVIRVSQPLNKLTEYSANCATRFYGSGRDTLEMRWGLGGYHAVHGDELSEFLSAMNLR
jgi:hypothetical protein